MASQTQAAAAQIDMKNVQMVDTSNAIITTASHPQAITRGVNDDRQVGTVAGSRDAQVNDTGASDQPVGSKEAKPGAENADELPRTDAKSERRADDVEKWFGENVKWGANSAFPTGYRGGSNLAQALNGESSLGALSPQEQNYLIRNAAKTWAQPTNHQREYSIGDSNAVRNLPAKVKDKTLLPKVAEAYMDAAVDAIDKNVRSHGSEFLAEQALIIDPNKSLSKLGGRGEELAKRFQDAPVNHPEILKSLSRAEATPQNAELTTQMFLHPAASEIGDKSYNQGLSEALANNITRGGTNGDRTVAAERINAMVESKGGQNLLLNDKVAANQRLWALQKTVHGEWTPGDVEKGWESKRVAQDYIKDNQILERYANSPINGSQINGEKALYDFVGASAPHQTYQGNDAKIQADIQSGKRSAYQGNENVDNVVAAIRAAGGDKAKVTASPVVFTSKEAGLALFNVYKVEGPNGTKYVDHNGTTFNSVEEWSKKNDLPEGQMTYAKNLDAANRNDTLITENTPNVVDTASEHVTRVFRYASIGFGIAAAGAFAFGTGGVGPLLVASVGTGLIAGGSELTELHNRGHDLGDLSNSRVRSAWFETGSSLFAIGSLGVVGKATQLTANGSRFAPAARWTAAAGVVTSNAVDLGGIANSGYDIYENWNRMTPSQRVQSVGQLMFFGGVGYGVTKATGGKVFDGFTPAALERSIAAQGRQALQARNNWVARELNNTSNLSEVPGITTRAPLVANDKLEGNALRTRYDMVDGKPTNARLEYNPNATYSWDDLASHAKSIETLRATGSVKERIGQWFKGEQPLPTGSLGWEARSEIDKLADRAQRATARLDAPNITPAEKTQIQGELADIERQTERYRSMLDQADVRGRGYIAQDSYSTQLAKARGLPTGDKLPEHHYWSSRTKVDANGVERTELFLQRTNSDKAKELYFYDRGAFYTVSGKQNGYPADQVERLISAGLTPVHDNGVTKLYDGTRLLAEVREGTLSYKYNGFGGDIVANPNKATTVLGKFSEDPADPLKGTRYFLGQGSSVEGFPAGTINRGVSGAPPKASINFLDLPEAEHRALIQKNIDEQVASPANAHLSRNAKIRLGIQKGNEEFWHEYNYRFLEDSFKRGDNIRLVSDPDAYVTDIIKGGTYKRELDAIGYTPTRAMLDGLAKKYDYTYHGSTMTYMKR